MKKMTDRIRKRKRLLGGLAVCIAAVFVIIQCSDVAYAYFNRGTVTMTLGKSSVSVAEGSSESFSVAFSPASDDQLPGCGMAECPQICGDKECLDENYNCCCAGTTYSTYYAFATVTSSNTSVATASYDNGVVTVTGVGTGTATITLEASLRQYTSSTKTVDVTVTAKSSSSGSGSSSSSGSSSGSSGSSSGSSGSTSIGVTQVAGADTSSDTTDTDTDDTSEDAENEETEDAADEEETDADDDGITVIESDKGTIWFVPITGLEQGKDLFEEIIGRDDCYVDFQMLDAAETVLYAWEFCGSDVTVAEDMIFTIDSSTTAFEGCSYGSSSDSVYLSFAQEGDFVGNTTVYMKVDKYFADDEVLNLYQYDAENDEVTLLQEGLENESGYVTMELAADEGGELILTKQTLETVEAAAEGAEEDEDLSVDEVTNTKSETTATSSHKGAIAAVIIIIIIVVVIIICALLLRKRKKGGPEDGDADDDTEEPETFGSEEDTDGNEGIEEDPDDDADKNDGIGEEPDVETTDDSESEP